MKRVSILWLAALLLVVAGLTGCASKSTNLTSTPMPFGKGSLAVAGFTQPIQSWELLAGYVPEGTTPVSQDILDKLDSSLGKVLRQRGTTAYVPADIVNQCKEMVLSDESSSSRNSAWKYWLSVGKCQATDYLLIPQLLYWQERDGGEYGTLNPAAVTFDLYLLNVGSGKLEGRYRFEETQEALLDNLFDAGKYFKRSGKWITAQQLAEEGFNQGLGDLGL